jgi:hypothetical protein
MRQIQKTARGLMLFMVVIVCGSALGFALLRPGRHTLVGELVSVNMKAGKFIVRTADGVEHEILYTGRMVVHGAGQAGTAAYLAGKQGSEVVVHYTQRGATSTANEVDVYGHKALTETRGTLVSADKEGHQVVIRTEDGAEHTYDVSKDAVMDTSAGVIDKADLAAKKGDQVVVYHAQQGAHQVAQAFKDLGHKIY